MSSSVPPRRRARAVAVPAPDHRPLARLLAVTLLLAVVLATVVVAAGGAARADDPATGDPATGDGSAVPVAPELSGVPLADPTPPPADPPGPVPDDLPEASPLAPDARRAAPRCGGEEATIVGTRRADELRGTIFRDVVVLEGGDDVYQNPGGDDLVCAGPGDDAVSGSSGEEVVLAGPGDDELSGGSGDDRLLGGAGTDSIAGEAGDDLVSAGADADYVLEGDGDDRVVGGPGADYLSYFASSEAITVRRGRVVTGASGRDRLSGVETVEATGEADRMIGTRGADDFRGLTGDDRIRTFGGDDVVVAAGGRVDAGSGNDQVVGLVDVVVDLGPGTDAGRIGSGRVRVAGGPGDDLFQVDSRRSTSRIDGGAGLAQLILLGVRRSVRVDLGRSRATWRGGSARVTGVHSVIGTNRADRFAGTRRSDQFFGLRGDDVMSGGGGADGLYGYGGRDRAAGGGGFDVCVAERRTSCEA